MARVLSFPDPLTVARLRGTLQFISDRGTLVVKRWPRKRGPRVTDRQRQAQADFRRLVQNQMDAKEVYLDGATEMARGTGYTWRDVVAMCLQGKFIQIEGHYEMDIQGLLDQIAVDRGAMLVRIGEAWSFVPIGALGDILRVDPDTGLPAWFTEPAPPETLDELLDVHVSSPASNNLLAFNASTLTWENYSLASVYAAMKALGTYTDHGITSLTGDVTTPSGDGSQPATLAASGVTAGTYSRPTLTVDAKGRVTAASSGAADAGITELTGDVTAGPGPGSEVATLATVNSSVGSFSAANITVDAKGRVTAAANGSTGGGGSAFAPAALAFATHANVTINTFTDIVKQITGFAMPAIGGLTRIDLSYVRAVAGDNWLLILRNTSSGNGYLLQSQGDENLVLYRFTSTTATSLGALNSGGAGRIDTTARKGPATMALMIGVNATSDNQFAARAKMTQAIYPVRDTTYDLSTGTWELLVSGPTGFVPTAAFQIDLMANPWAE